MTDSASAMAWTGFELAGEALALPAAAVEQVMAASPVTALPFAPPAVEGVASVSGDVIPVLDPVALRHPDRPAQSRVGAQFMIVRFAGQRFAIRIERMLFVAVMLSPESDGVMKWHGTSVTCLEPASLGLSSLEPKVPPHGLPGTIANSADGHAGKDMTQAETAVLAVEVSGRLYGLPSQSVVELLEHAELTPLPLVPPALRGVMVLRGQPLLAFCLDRLLGGAGAAMPRGHVVLSVGRSRIVLLVDSIVGLQRQGSQAVRLDPAKLVDSE
ncbi:MAG: chemotaxis protein CheW, partial [Enhydrobacter sp.]